MRPKGYTYTLTATRPSGAVLEVERRGTMTPNGGGDIGEDWWEDDDTFDPNPTVDGREISEDWPTGRLAVLEYLDRFGKHSKIWED